MRRLRTRADETGERLARAAAAVEEAWSDRGFRWLAVLATASLWLSLALRDVGLLGVFCISGACLWWRRRRQGPVELDADDWL